jgi:acetyl esterase/lipase
LLAPTESLEPASPDSIQELQKQFRAAYESEDWPTAIEIGTQLARTLADEGSSAYNLACAYARSGDSERALQWLRSSAEAGFSTSRLLASDPDLDLIRQETEFEGIAARVEENRLSHFEWFTDQAREIEPLVVLPDDHDPAKPAPLIVALHGRGGAILVAPDAIRVLGGGYQWRFLDESVWLVTHTIASVAEKYAVDDHKILLTGFSQGAYIAMVAGLRQPERYCGLVLVSGFYDPEDWAMPTLDQDNPPRVQFLIGSEDSSAPSYRQAIKAFKAAGWKARLRIYPGVGHAFPTLRKADLKRVLDFVCGI